MFSLLFLPDLDHSVLENFDGLRAQGSELRLEDEMPGFKAEGSRLKAQWPGLKAQGSELELRVAGGPQKWLLEALPKTIGQTYPNDRFSVLFLPDLDQSVLEGLDGLSAHGSELRDQGSELMAQGWEARLQCWWLKAQGSGIRAQGSEVELMAQGLLLKAEVSMFMAQG